MDTFIVTCYFIDTCVEVMVALPCSKLAIYVFSPPHVGVTNAPTARVKQFCESCILVLRVIKNFSKLKAQCDSCKQSISFTEKIN